MKISSPARSARGTVLTRRGYLKIVKPMSDDLAWQVQGEMIDRYFTVERIKTRAISGSAAAREAAQVFRSYHGIAKLIGLDRNQSLIAASQATRKCTGIDPLAEMGTSHFVAPQQDALLTPTEIGTELDGRSAKQINLLLQSFGFQDQLAGYWSPTERGMPFGVFLDTGKQQGAGTPIRQLKWTAGIVAQLRSAMSAENAND